MNVHIITPFYRKHLLKTLINYYAKHNIIWHPVCDEIDIEPFRLNTLAWVEPLLCLPLVPSDMCYRKFNDFLNTVTLIDEDYYGFAGDDDMFELGFFDELKKRTADIVFNSSYRGDTIPNDGGAPHPPGRLGQARVEDVRVCGIGLGMFWVKGSVLKDLRFNNNDVCDDGVFAMGLLNLGKSIEFMPETYLLFNYLQPGRFTNPAVFIKPTWKLPEIIE